MPDQPWDEVLTTHLLPHSQRGDHPATGLAARRFGQRSRQEQPDARIVTSMWGAYSATLRDTSPMPREIQNARPRGRKVVQVVLAALVILTVAAGSLSLASASASSSSPQIRIPPAEVYGSAGQRFEMTFLRTPSTCIPDGQCGLEVGCPARTAHCGWSTIGVVSRRTWTADDQLVWIWNLQKPVTTKEISKLLSQFPFGYRSIFDGLPAVRELVACFDPAGACPGYVGGIDVVDGSTMYVVSTTGFDKPTTEALLDSFRIIG